MKPLHTQATLALGFGAAMTLVLTGCSPTAEEIEDPVVVVTTSVFGDVVQQIVGDSAEVTVLIPAGSDPHEYQPSTKDINLLHTAELVFAVGNGFEEALESQLIAAESDGTQLIELSEFADPLSTEKLYGHHDHDHDHDHEDEDEHSHGPIDPHFWHDPERMMLAVEAIAQHLADVPGIDHAQVETQVASYTADLHALDEELAEKYATIPEAQRSLITQHNVLGYLAGRYHLDAVGAMIPSTSTLAQSSAAQLNTIVQSVEGLGVRAVFTDVTQSDALARTIEHELQDKSQLAVVPLYTESLSEAGGEADTYLTMMRVNAARIVAGLTGATE